MCSEVLKHNVTCMLYITIICYVDVCVAYMLRMSVCIVFLYVFFSVYEKVLGGGML